MVPQHSGAIRACGRGSRPYGRASCALLTLAVACGCPCLADLVGIDPLEPIVAVYGGGTLEYDAGTDQLSVEATPTFWILDLCSTPLSYERSFPFGLHLCLPWSITFFNPWMILMRPVRFHTKRHIIIHSHALPSALKNLPSKLGLELARRPVRLLILFSL